MIASEAVRPDLEVLVATYEERILGLQERLPTPRCGVTWLVSHQAPSGTAYDTAWLLERSDVRYLRWGDSGLSRNRNHCLDRAVGTICLIADDDLRFVEGWSDRILDAFRRHPASAFLTFRTVRGGRSGRGHGGGARAHTRRSVFRASSTEIAFILERVRATGVRFDERLGVGQRLGFGEELVFLRDLILAGADGASIPADISVHEGSTTGDRAMVDLDDDILRTLGCLAVLKRGWLAGPLLPKEAVRLARLRGGWRATPAVGRLLLSGMAEGVAIDRSHRHG